MPDERANLLLEYSASIARNREFFLLEFGDDYRKITDLVDQFKTVWSRAGKERDIHRQSQAGLIPLTGLVSRSILYGFSGLQQIQLAVAWPNVRHAIETMLIVGKFVGDPKSAQIWNQWKQNKSLYIRTFQGQLDVLNAFPRSGEFRKLLSRINDEYLHPNPAQVFSSQNIIVSQSKSSDKTLDIRTVYTGGDRHIINAHVLCFVRVIADIVDASRELTNTLWGLQTQTCDLRLQYEDLNQKRVADLIKDYPDTRAILMELGRWTPHKLKKST